MNSREIINEVIVDYSAIGLQDEKYVALATALRDLDQLLIDMVEQAKFLQSIESILGHTGFDSLLYRAAQAGYGEK